MKQYKIENINRIDKEIASLDSTMSREAIQRMIKEGKILVNGKTVKSSYKTNIGDIITIEEETAVEIDLKPQEIPINIVYEDKDILIVNKEKGMVVHPGNGNPDGTLANAVIAHCKESLSGIGGKIRPGIVHRIDKDTSGLVIIAKNDLAHINLSNQIQSRKVKKTYVALVRGNIKENEATINMPIGRSTKDRKKMAVIKTGKEAITHLKVLEGEETAHSRGGEPELCGLSDGTEEYAFGEYRLPQAVETQEACARRDERFEEPGRISVRHEERPGKTGA